VPPFRWRKLGLVFCPDGAASWARSHAQLPTPLQLEGSLYRVYCATRDVRNRSYISYFDLDLEHPSRPLRTSERPVLSPGLLGCFDDHGVYPASVVRDGREIRLYTIGWNPGPRPPLFYASIGLAVSRDGGETFEKVGRAPLMARSEHDPCLVTSPVVRKEGDVWRMWYVSGYAWIEDDYGVPESHYHIKYAESKDGIHWRRDGRICIDHAHPGEKNIARCWVLEGDGERYAAWYSFAASGRGYRIGYASSPDGLTWRRRDGEAGIGPSEDGFDANALAYPAVVRHGACLFMFYNGNGFGRDGVGLAVAEGAR
jgi:predicted GH43/DUF377 family glycosyl hydrolase